jgi:hypothetical protein
MSSTDLMIDEVRLAEDEVRVIGLLDLDGDELHGTVPPFLVPGQACLLGILSGCRERTAEAKTVCAIYVLRCAVFKKK